MIACDIVLLPPSEIMRKAMDINRKLIEEGNSDIVLGEEKCIPHITLGMGCIKKRDMSNVSRILEDIAESFVPMGLTTVSAKSAEATWKIEKIRDIEVLHEIVMIRLAPFFSYTVEPAMFSRDTGEFINDLTLHYIKKFPIKSSFENYQPHITLGAGEMTLEVPSLEFVTDVFALCHLGNFCTCREVFSAYRFKR
ncbi:MAG: hypothetical protein HQ594_00390 [Candidatus Omnitrophica bacterium]|nr:hypothetical protein [Candidatus Omnitrophota bacterium]